MYEIDTWVNLKLKNGDRQYRVISDDSSEYDKPYCVFYNTVNKIWKQELISEWKPQIGELCWLIELNGKVFLDTIKDFGEGFTRDFSVISKKLHKTKNYCPCCAEKEPFIEIDDFEYAEPFVGIISDKIDLNNREDLNQLLLDIEELLSNNINSERLEKLECLRKDINDILD